MKPVKTKKQFVLVEHAAKALNVSPGLIYKLRLSGTPGIISIGRSVRVDLKTLLRHLRGQH